MNFFEDTSHTPEQRLWAAVLSNAFTDALDSPEFVERIKRTREKGTKKVIKEKIKVENPVRVKATQWILEAPENFKTICNYVDLLPEYVQKIFRRALEAKELGLLKRGYEMKKSQYATKRDLEKMKREDRREDKKMMKDVKKKKK